MTTKKVTKTVVNADGTTTTVPTSQYETTTATAPATANTNWDTKTTPVSTATTTSIAAATPNTTSGTTIFTTANGNTVAMTTKKVTKTVVNADGTMTTVPTNQYETTTTTAPAAANTNWNSGAATASTTTAQSENSWTTANSTTTTNNTNSTPSGNTSTAAATHVYRGYGEKLSQVDPQFPGGQEGMDVWIRNHLSYVLQTQSLGEWKRGYIWFTVTNTGKATNPMMMTGISKEVDAAAIAMVNQMPNWNPATVSGTAVEKQFILPLDCFIPAVVPVANPK
jgi:hypothetical protein